MDAKDGVRIFRVRFRCVVWLRRGSLLLIPASSLLFASDHEFIQLEVSSCWSGFFFFQLNQLVSLDQLDQQSRYQEGAAEDVWCVLEVILS